MSLRRPRWLDQVYPIPDPFATIEEWRRARHEDIAMLAPCEIEDQRIRVRIRLALDRRGADPWLSERLMRLRAAQRGGRR